MNHSFSDTCDTMHSQDEQTSGIQLLPDLPPVQISKVNIGGMSYNNYKRAVNKERGKYHVFQSKIDRERQISIDLARFVQNSSEQKPKFDLRHFNTSSYLNDESGSVGSAKNLIQWTQFKQKQVSTKFRKQNRDQEIHEEFYSDEEKSGSIKEILSQNQIQKRQIATLRRENEKYQQMIQDQRAKIEEQQQMIQDQGAKIEEQQQKIQDQGAKIEEQQKQIEEIKEILKGFYEKLDILFKRN